MVNWTIDKLFVTLQFIKTRLAQAAFNLLVDVASLVLSLNYFFRSFVHGLTDFRILMQQRTSPNVYKISRSNMLLTIFDLCIHTSRTVVFCRKGNVSKPRCNHHTCKRAKKFMRSHVLIMVAQVKRIFESTVRAHCHGQALIRYASFHSNITINVRQWLVVEHHAFFEWRVAIRNFRRQLMV